MPDHGSILVCKFEKLEPFGSVILKYFYFLKIKKLVI